METSVIINTRKFSVRTAAVDNVIQLCLDDRALHTYECADKQEFDLTFNTIRDTLEYVSIHALTKPSREFVW